MGEWDKERKTSYSWQQLKGCPPPLPTHTLDSDQPAARLNIAQLLLRRDKPKKIREDKLKKKRLISSIACKNAELLEKTNN